MAVLKIGGAAYESAAGETVLDALLRQGVQVANSCRAGACQSCLMKAAPGCATEASQRGLKTTLREQGYFLSCMCVPETDMELAEAGGLEVAARIAALEQLTPTVLRARLATEEPLEFRPGQYITLRREDGLARSYSLAGLPEDGSLELHVRRAPGGRMSGWLFEEAREGDAVSVRGPAGDCFYTAGKPEQALLLAGTGTGLAPLVAICRDALKQGHTGPIQLFHGALRPEGLYLREELRRLEEENPNVTYTPVVLEGGNEAVETGALDAAIARKQPKLAGWRAFLCGDAGIVQLLRKKVFLAGVGSRDIFFDAFLEAPVR